MTTTANTTATTAAAPTTAAAVILLICGYDMCLLLIYCIYLFYFSPLTSTSSYLFIFLTSPLYFLFFLLLLPSHSLSFSHYLSLPLPPISHLDQLYHHTNSSISFLFISHLSLLLFIESVKTTVSRHFSCFKSILSSCIVVKKRPPCPDIQYT